ncbi:sigma-70 family RNA polymerase sigma factor [Paenibacillus tarimensis]
MQHDINLVQSAANGDIEAFAALVRTYTNAVCAVAYGVLRDYHLAQDIAQETFVKAHTVLHTLKQPEKFGSWLYSIATRLSIDMKRKQSRDSRLRDKLKKNHIIHTTEPSILQNELHLDIMEALDKLDDMNRTIVLSYYISEMSMPEIANAMNLSISAVESRIRRNRKLLKEDYLAAWEMYFGNRQSTETLVAKVVERIVKQAGQYYIPVSDRTRSTDWFVGHFGLSLDHNGHLQLPSGHTLFLIEVNESVHSDRIDSQLPVLIFLVEDPVTLYEILREQGIQVEKGEQTGIEGDSFFFFDLDGNRFGIFSENK